MKLLKYISPLLIRIAMIVAFVLIRIAIIVAFVIYAVLLLPSIICEGFVRVGIIFIGTLWWIFSGTEIWAKCFANWDGIILDKILGKIYDLLVDLAFKIENWA